MLDVTIVCKVPTDLHPMARTALEGLLSGWYEVVGYGNPGKAFLYHATIVDSSNFEWAECLLRVIGL